jgi:large subunit ribosomal protein L6
VGFSHPVVLPIPAGLKVECPSATQILVGGPDKQLVGEFAARVRRVRPPEPYKGKGVRYYGEQIVQKAGKSFVGGEK